MKAYETTLKLAPENEDQGGVAGRGASAYWFATHTDEQRIGSAPMHSAQDWAECAAEGGSAKARRWVARNASAVLRLETNVVALVGEKSLYKDLGARH